MAQWRQAANAAITAPALVAAASASSVELQPALSVVAALGALGQVRRTRWIYRPFWPRVSAGSQADWQNPQSPLLVRPVAACSPNGSDDAKPVRRGTRLRSRPPCRHCPAVFKANGARGKKIEFVGLAGIAAPPPRVPTTIAEFDRVLGGGLVPASVVLVGGDPGIGKSTLLLQAGAALGCANSEVVYISGRGMGRPDQDAGLAAWLDQRAHAARGGDAARRYSGQPDAISESSAGRDRTRSRRCGRTAWIPPPAA